MKSGKNMVFDKNWFKKHNKTLCWFANQVILKYWFRRLLRIHNDVKWTDTINRITPNSFSYNAKVKGKELELVTDFRTHEKFGKRLYYGLKPLWYLLHFWDWSTSIQPALNCGFDTLTVYPQASGGATTTDGWVMRQGDSEDWGNLVAGAGTGFDYDDAQMYFTYFICDFVSSGKWATMYRSIFTFNTYELTSSAIISDAVMSLRGTIKGDDTNRTPNIDIYLATPNANNGLQAADYGQIGTTSQTGSPIAYADFVTDGYNDFTFNATGIGNISKTGISRFGARNANYDAANSAPTWPAAAAYFQGYFADESGTTSDPKLVITYRIRVDHTADVTENLGLVEVITESQVLSSSIIDNLNLLELSIAGCLFNETIDDSISLSDLIMGNIKYSWKGAIKNTTTFNNQSKNTTSYDNQAKNKITSRLDD